LNQEWMQLLFPLLALTSFMMMFPTLHWRLMEWYCIKPIEERLLLVRYVAHFPSDGINHGVCYGISPSSSSSNYMDCSKSGVFIGGNIHWFQF
jgi:hypothetical protein